MKDKGFFGIGCINMKSGINYGTLFRTAQILNADFIFLIGKRFEKMSSDTMCSYKHIPLFEYSSFEDFNDHRPYGCQLVCIELDERAVMLNDFKHPRQAAYLLGAEDNGIPKNILNDCQHIVKLYGERSMNVAVAGSIVIYDRVSKRLSK